MPILIAIGGATGAGKTTLAYALRRAMPRLAGALVVEGDQTRRRMLGYDLATKMAQEDYAPEVTARVEAQKALDIRAALSAGRDVIDASGFWSEDSRAAIESLAVSCNSAFVGLWLNAPREILVARIGKRLAERAGKAVALNVEKGHASDACVGVLEKYGVLPPPTSPNWQLIDASREIEEVIVMALKSIPQG